MKGKENHVHLDLLLTLIVIVAVAEVMYWSDSDILIMILVTLFSLVIPGRSVNSILPFLRRMDAIERSAIAAVTGTGLTFISIVSGDIFLSIGWKTVIMVLLLPICVFLAILAWVLNDGDPSYVNPFTFLMEDFRSLSRVWRLATVIATIAMVLTVSFGVMTLSQIDEEGFTEFYVLNSEGEAYNYPRNFTVNQTQQLILGIANHEGYTVNYTVEIWLVNYTFEDMAVTVYQMYWVKSYNIVLDHVPYSLDKDWAPQYEAEVDITLSSLGSYKLVFFIYEGGSRSLPDAPLETTVDYATSVASWKIVEMVNNDVQHLMLAVDVSS